MMAECAEPFEDLFQLGCLGLVKALNRYNPKAENVFSSFAVPYIKGEIRHFLRDHAGVAKMPRQWHETHSRLKSMSKKNPGITIQQQAQELGISEDHINEVTLAASLTRGSTKELPEFLLSGGSEIGFDYTSSESFLARIASQSQDLLSKLPQLDKVLLESVFQGCCEQVASELSVPSVYLSMQVHTLLAQVAALAH